MSKFDLLSDCRWDCVRKALEIIEMSLIKIGTVCVCQRGIIGIVSKIRSYTCRDTGRPIVMFEGYTLNNKPWQSSKPFFIAESIEAYYIAQIDSEPTENITMVGKIKE